jgi:hypothetical protein
VGPGQLLRSRLGIVLAFVLSVAPVAAVAGSVTNDAAGAAGSGLSHFECYTASVASSASFRSTAHQVNLKNGFDTSFSAAPGAVRMQCNPAHQSTRSGVTPIKNPAAHLLCWAVKPKGAALPPLVTVTNDFGTGALKPIAARSLCVPSWTSKTRKVPSATAPSGLDTYVCYAVVHPAKTPAFHAPSKVVLADQFGTATRKIFAPNLACVATSKSHAGAWTRIINPTDLAVCFATTSAAKPARTVHDKNQFGTGAVKLTRSTEVCLPSLKASVTPPNTVTTTTSTTTPTTTTAPTTTTTIPTYPPVWTPSSASRISWYWQLQGTVSIHPGVTVYDVDGFNTSAATVAALHASAPGAKVICYLNVGAAENFRSDYSQFPASVLGATDGFPGENWLDIRQLSVIEPIMTARMQMCASKGFDAIEPDNVDSYTNVTGFPLSAQDQLTYDMWIANTAHGLGLSVGLKNDFGQVPQLEPYFDWALDEQCDQFTTCGTLVYFTQANKAVFDAEYMDESALCATNAAAHINQAFYDVNLDGLTWVPCTNTW